MTPSAENVISNSGADIVGRGRRTEADGGRSFFFESRPPQGRTRTADLEISTEPDGSGPKIQADRPPQGRKRTADRDFFVQSGPKRTEADGPPMMGISVIKIHHTLTAIYQSNQGS